MLCITVHFADTIYVILPLFPTACYAHWPVNWTVIFWMISSDVRLCQIENKM